MAVTFNQAIPNLQITDFHLLTVEQDKQDPMICFEKAANAFRSGDSSNGLRLWEKGMSLASLSQQKEFVLTFNNLRRFHGQKENGLDITYNFSRACNQVRLQTLEIFLFSRVVNSTAQATLFNENCMATQSDDLKQRVHLQGDGDQPIERASNKRLEFIISCTRQLLFDFGLDAVPGGTVAKFVLRRSLDTFCDFYTAPSVQSFVSNTLNTLRHKGMIILKA
ncbi:MAG: hypothetical protein HWD61_02395 [Parachlamydiaceae bacterium]|nr:MAG: hypothetical protein HWD61_02395 [Parachlamydiaceae bacterium]